MGKFANELEDGPAMMGPGVETPGMDGMSALGKPVPFARRSRADQHLKAMGVTDPEKRMSCVGHMVERIERDDPHGAMEGALRYVDATGCYRLLAVLLTGPND